ncbi:MaoC family dehydratase [Muriicola sp. Z0-33]|uniref:MaoC family dehydratase n=1 Tax=Muriicola sp. Z0-33 TaxID=2816957 RepID=UPI002238A4A5|nr:MaoC family dehydratase [Muriicola sp. Z0-33]MCW5516196.1 MaoC family dehydratase [Muriicola sp. Z0-33]
MAKLELENFKQFRELEGKSLPLGDWMQITQEMINDFAKATTDFQWIHTDVEKAKRDSPFKKTIAHGFMSVSLISKLLGDVLKVNSVKMGINYGLNKVRFPSPVIVDSFLRLNCIVQSIEEYRGNGLKITWHCTVEIKDSKKPACVAEFVSLMFE